MNLFWSLLNIFRIFQYLPRSGPVVFTYFKEKSLIIRLPFFTQPRNARVVVVRHITHFHVYVIYCHTHNHSIYIHALGFFYHNIYFFHLSFISKLLSKLWRGGVMVKALGKQPKGCEFNPRRQHYCVVSLNKVLYFDCSSSLICEWVRVWVAIEM